MRLVWRQRWCWGQFRKQHSTRIFVCVSCNAITTCDTIFSGSVRDIRIQHNVFTSSQCENSILRCCLFWRLKALVRYGFNVKSGRGRGGEVRGVLFAHNVVVLAISEVSLGGLPRGVQAVPFFLFNTVIPQAIRINMFYSTQPLPGPPETTPTFSDISIINVTGAAVTESDVAVTALFMLLTSLFILLTSLFMFLTSCLNQRLHSMLASFVVCPSRHAKGCSFKMCASSMLLALTNATLLFLQETAVL